MSEKTSNPRSKLKADAFEDGKTANTVSEKTAEISTHNFLYFFFIYIITVPFRYSCHAGLIVEKIVLGNGLIAYSSNCIRILFNYSRN